MAASPDLFVPSTPMPKGSGTRRLVPANCPLCYRRIPSKFRIGRIGPWLETANLRTKTQPAHRLDRYADAVSRAAALKYKAPIDGPVEVRVQFRFERPKSVKRSYPHKEADIDKLQRAVFDALSKIAFVDDSRVCRVIASKVYAETPGVAVRVRAMSGQGNLF